MKYECKTIMLMITENCNLACTYCYEHNKSKKAMSFECAQNIIRKEFSDMQDYSRGEIELFGGEAFMEFDLIKQIYDFTLAEFPDIEIRFSNTTNGTLVKGEILDWLWQHKDRFFCTLSLDGSRRMQNTNRIFPNGEGTFDTIDIDFFRKAWPRGSAKMTVSEESVPYLAEGVKYIESRGFYCMATFASGLHWNINAIKDDLFQQMSILIDHYVENDTRTMCQMLNYNLKMIFYPFDNDFRYCGAGVVKKCYDVDGNCYPCQGLAPMTLGRKAEYFMNKDFKNFRLSDSNTCKRCKWVRLCRTCYAANYMETGSVEMNSSDMCFLNRVCILTSSKIQYERLIKKETLDNSDKFTLKAIDIIQHEIMSKQ